MGHKWHHAQDISAFTIITGHKWHHAQDISAFTIITYSILVDRRSSMGKDGLAIMGLRAPLNSSIPGWSSSARTFAPMSFWEGTGRSKPSGSDLLSL